MARCGVAETSGVLLHSSISVSGIWPLRAAEALARSQGGGGPAASRGTSGPSICGTPSERLGEIIGKSSPKRCSIACFRASASANRFSGAPGSVCGLAIPGTHRCLGSWLAEDIGRGDLTAAALQGQQGQAHWVAKQPGRFCGGPLVQRLFQRLDPAVSVRLLRQDGDAVEAGDCLLELQGPATALVAGERTALNLAMRLSGIATATADLVAQLEGTGVRLADTRKTTPGLRLLEKYAVRCGGGINHRMGLDDAAMLKENHIAWAGGITAAAIAAVRVRLPGRHAVIVEAETDAQALEAVQAGADGVLLDEFSPEQLTQLVPHLRELSTEWCGAGGLRHSARAVAGLCRHWHRSDLHQCTGHPQPLAGSEHAFHLKRDDRSRMFRRGCSACPTPWTPSCGQRWHGPFPKPMGHWTPSWLPPASRNSATSRPTVRCPWPSP